MGSRVNRLCCPLSCADPAGRSASGSVDSSFGSKGIFIDTFYSGTDEPVERGLVMQPDGS
jgi:hypothetical protein